MEKHTEDCLSMIHEIGQCTCDAMTDEQIDLELLEKEDAKQWSARKAQLVAKKYKAAGGGYRD